jgi:hypothetical protein
MFDQITSPLASVTSDGAYDQAGIYGTVGKRHPDAGVIVPPRSTAVLNEDVETTPARPHLQWITEHGRTGWQKRSAAKLDPVPACPTPILSWRAFMLQGRVTR